MDSERVTSGQANFYSLVRFCDELDLPLPFSTRLRKELGKKCAAETRRLGYHLRTEMIGGNRYNAYHEDALVEVLSTSM